MAPDPVPPPTPRDEMLGRVRSRGRTLRRRRRFQIVSAATAVCLVVTATVVAARSGEQDPSVSRIAGPGTVVTPSPTPEETPSPTPTETPEPEPEQAAEPTLAPTPNCRNSHDPVCGPFYWDPEPPPNDPMQLEVTYEPAEPVVGDEVTFTIRITDDAAARSVHLHEARYGGAGMDQFASYSCAGPQERHGSWAPPPKESWTEIVTRILRTEAAGTFDVALKFTSGPSPCGNYKGYDPYASEGVARTTITVRERETPSPRPE